MKKDEKLGFATELLHSNHTTNEYGALVNPIYQTSTFSFETVEEAGQVFGGEKAGFGYSRGGNPTVKDLEETIANLEGGEACVATSSGMGAVSSVLIHFLNTGDHLICGECLYSCSDIVTDLLKEKYGIEVTYVDTSDIEAIEKEIKDKTKVIYFETPTNPTMKVTNIFAVKEVVGDRDIKIIIDNTFSPPPIQYPLKEGADYVVHSATKYLNGHGDLLAGAIVGNEEEVNKINKHIVTKLTGTTISPLDAFLLKRGMKTLELRMLRHSENGQLLADYLASNPYVEEVFYPGIYAKQGNDFVVEQMNGLYSGIITFILKDDIKGMSSFESAKKLVNNLTLPKIAVSLGDPETLVQHPASMTHANLTDEQRSKSKISDGLVRVSVGLENGKDLVNDFKQAFERLYK